MRLGTRTRQINRRLTAVRHDAPLPPPRPTLSFTLPTAALRRYGPWVLAAVLLPLCVGTLQLRRLPPALASGRLADGTPVRLVAVTLKAPHEFSFVPKQGLCARFATACRVRARAAAVRSAAELPAEALTLWFWIGAPQRQPSEATRIKDEADREYVNGALVKPLQLGAQPWGRRATLAHVALTRCDRSAKELRCALACGQDPRSVSFNVPGPAQPPTPVGEASFPLLAGSATGELGLWQLRPLDLALRKELLSLAPNLPLADKLVLADLELREKGASESAGRWQLRATAAHTNRGEPLTIVQQRDGLVFLTTGRRPDFDALSLDAVASKVAAGQANVVFRSLEVPPQVGETIEWSRDAAQAPFGDGRFVARRGLRTAPGLLHVDVEGHAPPDSRVKLRYSAGLDDHGQTLRLGGEPGEPSEQRDEAGVTWHWGFDVRLAEHSARVALACALDYQAVLASSRATFTARLQPPRAPGHSAGLGLLLEPRGAEPAHWRVVQVLPGTAAQHSGVLAGDEVLTLDGLPPAQLSRVLLRHSAGQQVELVYQRGAQVRRELVKLDAL